MTVLRHPNNNGVTLSQWRKTAAGGETSLSGTDDFSAALAYTAGAEQVFVNGVLLERGVDYTASTGTTVTGLTALVAGDIVTVSSPSAFNVANAIPKSTVTTKGDLLAATGASTVTNLPVGADGTTLVANSASATGMAWAGPSVAAGKNYLINGAMDNWQRGASFSATGYGPDRWYCTVGGSAATFAQETSVIPAGSRYALKWTAGAASSYGQIRQFIEQAAVIPLRGQTMTASAMVQLGSSYSGTLQFEIYYSTTTDTITSFSGTAVSITTTTGTPTIGSYNKITATFTVPSNAVGLYIGIVPSVVQASGVSAYIGNVQLEQGSVATAFSRAGGTLQGELAACQRYYIRYGGNTSYDIVSFGAGNNTQLVTAQQSFPVQMRIPPIIAEYSNLIISDSVNATITVSTVASDTAVTSTKIFRGNFYTAATTVVPYRPYTINTVSSSGYLGLSAEL